MRPLSSSPNKSNTWTMCSLPLVSGAVARLCTSVHGSVSVVHGVHSVQNVLSPDGGFQRVFCEVCAHLQNVSDSVAELDAPRNPFDDSDELCACPEKTAPDRISARGAKAKPAPNPGSFFRPGPSGGRIWPDLAKSGAPAAILINAYSGDFCHPVLSNALGQEPLVYHSGTRELFSDIFGTFSEISTFSRFSRFSSNLTKSVQICKFTFLQMRAHSQNRIHKLAQVQKHFAHVRKFLQMCKCVNVQMCKCAKNRRAQNAQICSANIFPNAEITNLHCAQKHKCKFHKCANLQSVNFFLCKFLCASFVKIIYT